MGLDGVELAIEFEEAFGIDLTDEEAASCRTPRMVIDLIFSKLKTADEHICRSQRAFYRIRKALVGTFGFERKSITPDMQLRDRIPRSREKEVWKQIRTALGPNHLPGLVRPSWLTRALKATVFAIFAVIVIAMICLSWGAGSTVKEGVLHGATLGLFAAALFGIVAGWLTRPFCIYIPARMKSIRDLIPRNLASDRVTGWTREEVAVVVKRLVMEQLGLQDSDYTEDSRFREDFNMD